MGRRRAGTHGYRWHPAGQGSRTSISDATAVRVRGFSAVNVWLIKVDFTDLTAGGHMAPDESRIFPQRLIFKSVRKRDRRYCAVIDPPKLLSRRDLLVPIHRFQGTAALQCANKRVAAGSQDSPGLAKASEPRPRPSCDRARAMQSHARRSSSRTRISGVRCCAPNQ